MVRFEWKLAETDCMIAYYAMMLFIRPKQGILEGFIDLKRLRQKLAIFTKFCEAKFCKFE